MKSPLLVAIIALQLVTLGLVVGLLVKGNDPERDRPLIALSHQLDGALNQEREIVGYIEMLRKEAAARAGGGTTAAGAHEMNVSGDAASPAKPPVEPNATAADPIIDRSPFPAAAKALADLKRIEQHLRQELANSGQNVGPLQTELKLKKEALLSRGHEAVYVVRREIELQPYEEGRDAKFVEYLLNELVPPLSSSAKDEAFAMARGAIVRSTNEAPIKFAAAKAMKQIDGNRWVKEVVDVISKGSGNDVGVRAQLLGLFDDTPRPEAVDLCRGFIKDATYSSELRTKAVQVIAKQNSATINGLLREVLFDDPAAMMKTLALDSLWSRITDKEERRKLLQEVVDAEPARMSSIQDKARDLLKKLDE